MNYMEQVFEIAGKFAINNNSYSVRHFLPRQVLELGVLNLLELNDRSGAAIIRELIPLSQQADGAGVHYPLLHDLENKGIVRAYNSIELHNRVYSLTEKGRNYLSELRDQYAVHYAV